jgi:hypothetical protein
LMNLKQQKVLVTGMDKCRKTRFTCSYQFMKLIKVKGFRIQM